MIKEENDFLEQQIGGFGTSEDMESNDSVSARNSLGKIKTPQEKQSLDEDEKNRLEIFLNKTQSISASNIVDGWIPIDKSTLKQRGRFYPEDWEFRIKPASVHAIKNWSSIDENSPAIVNNVFNEIIKLCVSIKSSNGNIPWGKINSWDRFSLILLVREYTFQKGEHNLSWEDTCPECDANITYILNSGSLSYEFPDESVIDKHWSQDDRMWIINPKDYDIDHPIVKLYTPTIEKDEAILQWAYNQKDNSKNLNEPFLRFLPWLLQKVSKDAPTMDKLIKDCQRIFESWDTDFFLFMDDVLRNITINPSERLKTNCQNCGEEVESAVTFPNGIKYLFNIPSRHKKFGTK